MDYQNLIVPIQTLSPFEEYVEPFCNDVRSKIEQLQRQLSVQLKRQGIQTRTEVRSIWPEYATEYKKLLVETTPGASSEENVGEDEPLLGCPSEDESKQFCSSDQSKIDSGGQTPCFLQSDPILEEEVFWKISFSQGAKINESKLFFFGAGLFRLRLGYKETSQQYYLLLAPAEKLKVDVKVFCKYRIHDPITEAVLQTQVADDNYTFKRGEVVAAGMNRFAGPELLSYLDALKRLSLSIVVSSEVGKHGELLGINLTGGSHGTTGV